MLQQQKYKWANHSKCDKYAQQNEENYARDSWGQLGYPGIAEEGWMDDYRLKDDPWQ